MRCLVIGTGSIGQRHCRNLVALGHDVVAWDSAEDRRREAAAIDGVRVGKSLAATLEAGAVAAFICTPPAHHVDLAWEALGAGMHLFIEKPIAHASVDVPALLAEAERRERLVAVGFNLRFLPSLRHVKACVDAGRAGRPLAVRAAFGGYLPDWRPGRDYRDNYAVSAALGGGILLDAIHELDYLGWLFGDGVEVSATAEHVSGLAGDTEDLAEVTVRFASGLLAQVHLDYLRRAYHRNLEIIGEDGVIVWDYPSHAVTVHGETGSTDGCDFREADGEPNQMYMHEVRQFIGSIGGRDAPGVAGPEALRALKIVEAAKASARQRRWQKI